jgi:hypothetical protein
MLALKYNLLREIQAARLLHDAELLDEFMNSFRFHFGYYPAI